MARGRVAACGRHRRARRGGGAADQLDRGNAPRSYPPGTSDRGRISRPQVVSGARTAGYRLVGRRLDYLLHLRPAEWPIMAGHTALGYLLAVGIAGAVGEHLGRALAGLLLWVVCLNGGTLALNSAF